MGAALASRDSVGVSVAAHALRGSSANIGARHLSSLCASLEDAGASTDADARTLIGAIDIELQRVYLAFAPDRADAR